MEWLKCEDCSKVHLGPQMTIDGVQVCPFCQSICASLIQVTKEEAMEQILPWRKRFLGTET